MAYVPTKRCDNLEKHEPHLWKERKVFKRQCPGRITTKAPARSRREGHPRSPRQR